MAPAPNFNLMFFDDYPDSTAMEAVLFRGIGFHQSPCRPFGVSHGLTKLAKRITAMQDYQPMKTMPHINLFNERQSHPCPICCSIIFWSFTIHSHPLHTLCMIFEH
jgi:hypothetical protein